jgi:hypothetical protein
MSWIVLPPKFMYLISWHLQNVTLREQSRCRCNQVSLYKGILEYSEHFIQCDWCPNKKKKFGHKGQHTGRMPHEDGGREGDTCPDTKCQKIASKSSAAIREAQNKVFLTVLGRNQIRWYLRLPASTTVRWCISIDKAIQLVVLCYSSLTK